MNVEVRNHLLFLDGKQVPFRATPNKSGVIKPQVLVMHDTAGRIEDGGASSVSWLCNPKARASAHIVMGRDGEIVQLAPFNIATWHAGASSYRGRSNVNAFSIGIEIVNPGAMTERGGKAKPWWDQLFDIAQYGIERKKTKEHGEALWMPYTAAQIAMSKDMGRAIVRAYGLTDVTTHWFIAPGRKVDTNPLYPLAEVRAFALDTAFVPPAEPEKKPDAPKPDGKIGVVTADKLNFRRSPMGEITGSLPKGTRIEINSQVEEWLHVTTPAGYSGYVHGGYVEIQ